jgi:hypothetical protein
MEKEVKPKLNVDCVGKYCIGENTFCILLTKKPNRLKRFFMNYLLGWKWTNI